MGAATVGTALALTMLGAAGTGLGGLMVILQPNMSFKRLGVLQGLAAGLMLCISVNDLLPAAVAEVGFVQANAAFYLGVIFFALIVYLIPEPSPASIKVDAGCSDDNKELKHKKRKVLMSGLITALGIALHNFPEGVAIFLASMKSQAIGVSLAFAIALHNVPEGVAVALPVYFATGSRLRGFMYAFVSGLAEPLAVVLLGYLLPVTLNKDLVENMLAAVGGIMAFLAFHELLPLSMEHAGKHAAIAALFAGMALMSLNLYILDHWLGAGH